MVQHPNASLQKQKLLRRCISFGVKGSGSLVQVQSGSQVCDSPEEAAVVIPLRRVILGLRLDTSSHAPRAPQYCHQHSTHPLTPYHPCILCTHSLSHSLSFMGELGTEFPLWALLPKVLEGFEGPLLPETNGAQLGPSPTRQRGLTRALRCEARNSSPNCCGHWRSCFATAAHVILGSQLGPRCMDKLPSPQP